MMESGSAATDVVVPKSQVDEWQSIVDLMARLIGVPAGLIMRVDGEDIEVFVSSATDGNPYTPGDREHLWGSGLYCETVISKDQRLLVPNALKDPDWDANPDIRLGMISYLGYPITYPDGRPFGTLCVLDAQENEYTEDHVQLLRRLRDLVQSHLALIYMNHQLQGENLRLVDYIGEIQTLRGIIPICARCKSVRDGQEYWHRIESYISARTQAKFSHSLCPECTEILYPGEHFE